MTTRRGRPPVKTENLAKARRLELPVFILSERIIKRKLGRPISAVGGPTSSGRDKWDEAIWTRSWEHYELIYRRDPQVNVGGNAFPDVMVYRDTVPVLAMEAKNPTKGTTFTWYTFQRDVLRYFQWLPSDCKRKLVCSYLKVVDSDREKVEQAIIDGKIHVYDLGFHVGPPMPSKLAYARLNGPLRAWLTEIIQ